MLTPDGGSALFIDGCINYGKIDGLGGIIGINNGTCTVSGCVNNGTVTSTDLAGGIIGENSGTCTVSQCTNTGAINGGSAGGIIGINNDTCTVNSCTNTRNITADSNVGGIIGGTFGEACMVNYCTNTGNITADSYVGGIIGYAYTVTLTNCTNSGQITGNSYYGDLIGYQEITDPTPWTGEVATAFAGGSGTEADPYLIETAEQLAYLAESVKNGTTYSDQYISLTSDIDLGGIQATDGTWSGQQWTPIGRTWDEAFQGNFDGGNYKIKNIYINTEEEDYIGLFGYTRTAAEISNIEIESGSIRGMDNTGGLVRICL